jgi:rhodanese-related sulfurtransferase
MKAISCYRLSQYFNRFRVFTGIDRELAHSTMTSKDATPTECKELLAGGAAFIDVRTPEEFAEGHHESATNIPIMLRKDGAMVKNDAFVEAVEKTYGDKDAPIVCYCQHGRRGGIALEAMLAAGYTNLTNMAGGYEKWKAEGL